MKGDAPIYHLVPEPELRAGARDGLYTPARFGDDGFVHCTAEPERVLAVARDYFAALAAPLLVLRIDPARLGAPVVYEAPAPIAGFSSGHAEPGARFPHVYGPIALAAVTGVARLAREGEGFAWPASFEPFARWLDRSPAPAAARPARFTRHRRL